VTLVLRAYELMLIFDRDVEEGDRNPIIESFTASVESGSGQVSSTDDWGLRQCAYEIDHKNEGHYMVFEIETESAGLDDVDRMLRLADEIVRHKIIRLPESEAERRGLLGGTVPADAG
jgi:small subunit ribosomal protein S6